MSKYRNKKTVVDGITFDSAKEARRWQELCLLHKSGVIIDLQRQAEYQLAPAVRIGGRMKPALKYKADFKYISFEKDPFGLIIVEDVKGVKTAVFRIKQHLMKTIHSIEILLT